MPLNRAKTFKEEEYWANLYGETIATPTASLPPATPEPEPAKEMGNFTRGLNMAVDEAQGLAGGVKALVGSSIGKDEWVDSGMEIYQRNMAEAEQYAGDVEKIEDIESFDEAGKWMAHSVGRFLPDIAMAVVSGGIGGAVTKKVVKEGIKKKANDQAQDIVQAGIEKDAADYIARMFAEKEAADAVGRAAFKGSVATAAAYTGQQAGGGSFARILEETGVEAPLTALGVGIASGVFEAAPFMKLFSSMFPKGKAKEFGEFIAGDLATKPPWVTSALIDIRDIWGINVATDAAQLVLDDAAVTYVNNNFSENDARKYANYVMDPEARSRMGNTLAVSTLMGLTMGAGTVAVKGARGDYRNPQFDDQANQTRTESNNNPTQRQEILRMFNEHRNKAKSLTGGPAPFDPISGKQATVWDGNGALNPETNQPYTQEDYTRAGVPLPSIPLNVDAEGNAGFLAENEPLTPEQRQEAGLSELTDYDGSDINVPQDIPEGTEPAPVMPESAPVADVPQQAMFAEDSLPPSPQAPIADIVTDFESAPAFGERAVPASSTESGTLYEYHNFEGQLSDPAKPVADQLVELSVAASTSEALDPSNTDVVVEAIDADDVARIFDRNDFLKMETDDKKSGKSLPTIDESFGENSQEATNVVAGVVADLSASGVPKSFLDSVTGIYVHKESELDAPALTGNNSRGISINSSLISGAVSDPKQLSELAWSMAHEVYHAADFSMGLSDKDSQFGITIVSERDQPTVVMGDVMDEIFTNWENRTELGKRFDYPFNDLQKEINDRDKPNEGLDKSYRQEVFAQLGAMFHSNPKLLQEQSPLAYNFIKGIRDSNLKTNNVPEVQSEGTSSPSDPNTTKPTGLRGQVRAPPESGSVESAPVADTGSDGEGSAGAGRTDPAVERQAQKKTGERQRPAVQEPNVKPYTVSEQTQEGNRQYAKEAELDRIAKEESIQAEEEARLDEEVSQLDIDDLSFIKKGAEYLLEKSEGELPSKKLVPVKSLTAKTDAEKHLAMVDTIVSNHPNALDSPEAWRAFERELTGSNTTIAPPYALIKLVNNPKLWAKKHSTLTPQQLEAADQGLATTKRMGDLYRSGAADSEATGKLLLWGLMSRMLTASAQEAGFVDLLTNSTAVTNLIEKALTGSFTDKTATRMVEVPKTKKKPKHMVEKTYNADIAEWRDYVQESIPLGSFGRSGTSNANDFGTLMMKMSELDDNGVSKLRRLHDLMADRSVSTAQVRREFQAMVQGSGIDNKVFSFVQLMIGRDDVVVLDRIQLNSMWDSDRYGKKIYGDIADEFGALRGAARYEAIENALKSKVKDLYTSLGRPEDASIGRYHWESWVRDSGQVVAHPTIKGLEKDIKGEKSPYALLGAPEGKMNTYAYSAIYARDEAGSPYYVYPNSKGTFFKFDLDKWLEFKGEISKPKNGIVDKNFKISEFDKGIPWYESDQVNRQKLDGLIESYAKRKALADEYSAEGAIASNDPNGFRRKRIYDRLRSPKSSDGSGSRYETEIPRRFGERPSRRTQVLVDGKSLPAYKRTLTPQAKKDLGLADSYNGNIFELAPSKESAELFASRMQSSKDTGEYGAAVDVYSPEKYQGMDLIITEDGTAGMASDGEYMASLFSNGTNNRVTYALLSLAIENGGRTADAFDTTLPSIYQNLGLKVVSRLKWDDSQAKDDWDKKTFSRYNNGEPDVVFLRHDPSYFDKYGNADGYYVDTYKEGLVSLNDAPPEDVSFIQKKKNNEENNTLDDGTPSTSQFSYNDEIDAQHDLVSRLKDKPVYRKLVDRYAPVEEFESQAADYLDYGRLPARISPRDQENLSHGRVQEDLDEFHKNFIDPLGDLITKTGIDPESVGVYLLAKHAKERNAHIAEKVKAQRDKNIARTKKEIEKLEADVEVDHTVALQTQREKLRDYETLPLKFQGTGSGMTNAEAQSVLNTAEREGTKEAMEKVASKVYEMLQYQRDRMVEAGLLDEVSKSDWEAKFKFYVPLKGFAAEEKGDSYVRGSTSRGFSVVGSESMKAKGRKTMPVNPLLTSIEDVQKKIIRARKNEYTQTLLDLLSDLGNSESYTIYNNKFRPPVDGDEGLTNPRLKDLKDMSRETRPNGDPKYVEVKKGGQTFFMYFESDSLNHSLQNMSVPMLSRANDDVSKLLTYATRFQTFRRNMLINYNPSWGLINPIRDVQTGLMYSLSEMDKKGSRVEGKNVIGKMAQGYTPAMRALWRHYRDKPVREGNAVDQYTKEFHEDGAQTGLMLVRDQDEQLRILKRKLKKGWTREAFRSIGKFVEDFNTTMENSIRLSAYIEARRAGSPREDAATLAKDLTVNFNRKGENTAVVNSMYLFFNAAVQGNVNIAQALADDGSSGKTITGARKAALGMIAFGTALAMANILTSEDDDDEELKYSDLPEHAKNRSLLFMYSQEEGFALPASYGWNFFTNIGRFTAELAMETSTPEEIAINMWDNVLLNFVPITPSKGDDWTESARGFYPDLLEFHLDLMANKNFFGSNIAIEQNPLFVQRSKSYISRRSTDQAFKDTAKFLNDVTGGDEFNDGGIALSPDRMQYLNQFLLGGVGRTVTQAADVASKMMADEEVRLNDLPVIGTFFKEPSEYQDRFEYYDNWEEVRKMKTQILGATAEELPALYERFKPFVTAQKGEALPVLQGRGIPNLYDLANKDILAVRKQRKLLENQNYGAGVLGDEKRKEMLDILDQKENKIFDLFNKAYRKAEKKAK